MVQSNSSCRYNSILNAPVEYQRYKRHIPTSKHEKLRNKNRLDHMIKIFCNSGYPDADPSTEPIPRLAENASADHSFWTKSQNRVFKNQVQLEETGKSLSKFRDLGIKPLDLSKLRRDFLPEAKMKKLFSEESILTNLKNKYLMKNLLQETDDYHRKDSRNAGLWNRSQQ